jgi:type VI secretion system protein ImpI
MGLILTIENEESLPNGAPTRVRLEREGGLEIGRGATRDWCLPDPSRFVSSKHCEIRYRDGAYWLYDISSNGTFLNASTSRLQAPHRLADGDHFVIGTYIIAVSIEPEDDPAESLGAFAPAPIIEAVPVGPPAFVPAQAAQPTPAEFGDMQVLEDPGWHEPANAPELDENRQREPREPDATSFSAASPPRPVSPSKFSRAATACSSPRNSGSCCARRPRTSRSCSGRGRRSVGPRVCRRKPRSEHSTIIR